MPRLFLGIPLPQNVRLEVVRHIQILSARIQSLKIGWIHPEKLHMTLRFFGTVSDVQVSELVSQLKTLARTQAAFEIHIGRLGAFPHEKAPRVIWMGIKDPQNVLSPLARDVELYTEEIVPNLEKRAYIPHLTLGRVKEGRINLSTLFLSPELQNVSIQVSVPELVLYETKIGHVDSQYRKVEVFSLNFKHPSHFV
jgi:2'-5' RNA ligase